jgi:hypothetical protein
MAHHGGYWSALEQMTEQARIASAQKEESRSSRSAAA